MSAKRLEKIRNKFNELKIDSVLVTNPYDVFYLSGFSGYGDGYLIITADKAYIVTDSRYTVQAHEECPDFELLLVSRTDESAVTNTVASLGIKEMGFQDGAMTFAEYKDFTGKFSGVNFVAIGEVITVIRAVKDEQEIELVKKACDVAWQSFKAIRHMIAPGNKEVDIAAALEYEMRKRGASKTSFDTILASGPRGAMCHGTSTDRIIQPGEAVTVDFGALYEGYCSDMTRTVFAEGTPDPKLAEMYKIVEEAHDKAISDFKPGMTGIEVDKIARDVISSYGYGEYFGHGLGHGVGVEIHELPNVNSRGKMPLTKGMIFSIEPGIYIEGLGGIRIEDLGVVTDTGLEIITGIN